MCVCVWGGLSYSNALWIYHGDHMISYDKISHKVEGTEFPVEDDLNKWIAVL